MKKKITLNIEENLLNDFDILAKGKGLTRSALINFLMSDTIRENKEFIKELKEEKEIRMKNINLNDKVEDLMLKEKW